MLLALDVGNTHTVVGVFDESSVDVAEPRIGGEIPGLLFHWRVATVRDRTADELALVVRGLTALASLEMPMLDRPAEGETPGSFIDGLAISSSVPTQTAALREMAARYFDVPCVVVEPGIKTGMPILYDNPREVGADRISNAVAAIDLYTPPVIVVDLGTATTFDAISEAGEYLGGAISPGIEISMNALFERAEALRRIELREPKHAVGRTTVEAMQSGAIFGYAALVDGLCRRIEAEIGPSTIVATGGLSSLISPHASAVAHVEPWLTLHGLRLIYLRNLDQGNLGVTDDAEQFGSAPVEVPYSFPGTVPAGSVAAGHEALEAGERSGVMTRVAGRLMRNRPNGRVAFAELRDWSGSIQLFATEAETENFAELVRLSLGDWIGADGEIVRTRRGELSVQVTKWTLLAKARRSFGDKWRGVNDVEVRHRQREVDLWANEGVRETFLFRSAVVRSLRNQLDSRGFVEVETPVLQPIAGGANAKPFVTHYQSMHADFYLRIATELYLKRLVVGGFERVYEIGKNFRNEGLSPKHNPEFTLLEAYQVYADYSDLASLVEDLVSSTAKELLGTTVVQTDLGEVDLLPPWRRATMEELIEEVTGVACTIDMDRDEIAAKAADLDVEVQPAWGVGRILAEIYEAHVERRLLGPVHVMDYPAEVSPLSRRHRSREGLVERLTPIVAGQEIGEVYSELVDPDDQRDRFVAQALAKVAGDQEAMSLDEDFLRALEHGMPPTGGIGIGIDRLVMLLSGKSNIREVILFPALRADRSAAGGSDDGEDDDEEAAVTGQVTEGSAGE